ncbi:hypothetical protein [Solitalea koreensis]|uniref:DUF3805 domain-containing protein n=1 Tax=Solitalea koreensis TaxID=543615 RepID=A0A521DKZ4_9SPHI|nr:hypothetical protein [Solitalea koreensis]SMO72379.1 hypothetical protein SAMN06265350_107112 [Solitalea koreensis]SMO72382.1 hypothetical protein SAMN06265350_107113 [Solitalea koreensis]
MKKISILIVGIFLCLSSFGQVVPLNDVINFTPFKKMEKIDRGQLKQMDRTKVKFPTINIEHSSGEFYKLSSTCLLQLNGMMSETTDNYLNKLKKGFDASHSWSSDPGYTSVIKTYNNYQVLIINRAYTEQFISHYSFFCVSNTKVCCLNGKLEYNSADKEQAAVMLDELLKSIRFKK